MSTNAKPILALTVLDPWATLIRLSAKQYETRSWSTNYRGDLVVHAGKNPDYLMPALSSRMFASVLQPAGYRGDVDFHLGCALCVVTLAACLPVEQVRDQLDPDERAFGDFSDGRFAWKLEHVRPFARPIPWRGAQGLWQWTEPLPKAPAPAPICEDCGAPATRTSSDGVALCDGCYNALEEYWRKIGEDWNAD